MAMIKVTVDDKIEALLPDMALRIAVTSKDGAQHVIEVGNPLGHPNNPMLDRHINEKFIALAAPVVGQQRSEAIAERWWQVGDAADLRPLTRLLATRVPL
jgi:2-methylcitrate dehydratase PrpD